MWGLLAHCRTPYAENFMCAQSTWQGQTACQISASYLYGSCSYANMYFALYVPKNAVLGGFRVKTEDVKILSSDPQKALSRVNTRLTFYCTLNTHYRIVCWCIACQNRFNGLSSRSVERFLRRPTQKEIFKKLSGNFGYMGRSNPWGDLDQIWRVGRYGGRNHVCNILVTFG